MATEEIEEKDFNSQFLENVEPDEPTSAELAEEVEPVDVETEEPILEVDAEEPTDAVKAYRADQSKKDKRISALEAENANYRQVTDELGGRLNNLEKPPEPKNVLTKPERPKKPHGYNKVDAYTDPDTDSYAYNEALEQHVLDMEDFRDAVDANRQEEIQADKDAKSRVKQSTDFANSEIAKYQKQGLTQAEAIECFDFYYNKDESRDANFLVGNWKTKTKGSPRPPSKGKLKTPLPPGIDGGITDQLTMTVDDAMFERIKEVPDERQL
tara:strand:+ start:3285 stop:4091 length:807 start_codon:yes stop_codon:yes gene_type:complete